MIDLNLLIKTVGRLDEEKTDKILEEFISSNPDTGKTWEVVEAFHRGMEVVGNYFEIGKYCAGDLIFAGELLDISINKLKPFLGGGGGSDGKYRQPPVVLGTVEGDVHDIGKKLFKSLIELYGFRVEDIGVDQKPSAFVQAVRKYRPQVLGLSGVLTLSIAAMRHTVEAVIEAGLREKLKIYIGGNAVNEEVCQYVGADAWSRNAAETAKIFDTWF
jgi:methanogenic corrinoid protein MtbC1